MFDVQYVRPQNCYSESSQFTHARKSTENDGHVEICLEKQRAIVEEEIPPTAESFGFVASHAGQVTAALLPRLA